MSVAPQQSKSDLRKVYAVDFLGKLPSGILYSGNTLVALILIIFLPLGFLISYPDEVVGEALITTLRPPVRVKLLQPGKIDSMFVQDGDSIQQGEILFSIASPLQREHLIHVQALLTALEIAPYQPIENPLEGLQAEGLNEMLSDLSKKVKNYNHLLSSDPNANRISGLVRQAKLQEELEANLSKQVDAAGKECVFFQQAKDRVQQLVQVGAAPLQELATAEQAQLNCNQRMLQIEERKLQTSLELARLRTEIQSLQAEQVSEVQGAVHELLQVRDNLLGAIRLWEKEHVLRAPVDGIVSVTQNRIPGQLIGSDEAVMSILPFANVQAPVCIAHVGAAGLGKVHIGDKAKIYLEAFPDQEFGHLIGHVQTIAQLPDQSGGPSSFRIDIALENGLQSTYRKHIPFRQEMAASVAIITSKRSLIARIFDRLGKVFR